MRKRLLACALLLLAPACTPAETDPAADPGTGSGGGGGKPAAASGGSKPAGGGSPGTGGSVNPASGGSTGTGGGTGSGGTPGSGGAGSGGATGAGGSPAADAGSSEVAGPEAGGGDLPAGGDVPAAGGAGCEGSGAKVCLDFEDQMAGQVPKGNFKVETSRGTVLTDATKAFSGKHSVLIKSMSGTNFPGNNLVFSGLAAMLPENDLHGRVMMFMTAPPGQAHWDTIIGSAANGANPSYILGGMYRKFMSVYHPGDCSVDSSTVFPVGRWACIQWQFKGAKDGTHLHKMMLDGQVVQNGIQDKSQGFCAAGGGSRDWKAPTFDQLKVGHRHFGSSAAVDVWIDDLAFGDKPIPCPPMK